MKKAFSKSKNFYSKISLSLIQFKKPPKQYIQISDNDKKDIYFYLKKNRNVVEKATM